MAGDLVNAVHPMNRSLMWTMALALAVACGAAWMAASRAEVEAIADLRAEARSRLDLYRSNLVNSLNRHKDLALALARNHEIKLLLDNADNRMRADGVSVDLMHLAKATGVLAIFVINNQGRVLSSSNFKEFESFVGELLDFRAYFKDALKEGAGRLFAIGTKTSVAGYFIAYATEDRHGVVVIKVAVNELEDAWQQAPERVMVTDRSGIVFLTNVDSWRYKSLLPLDVATAARVKDELQYNGKEIEPLPLRFVENEVFTRNDDRFLMETSSLPNSDWTLRVLTETDTIRDRTINAALIAAIATTLTLGIAIFLMQRRRALRDDLAFQEQSKAELERQVRARTEELVQASKLATLGQMALEIAHEFNQPIGAIRMNALSSDTLLTQGRVPAVRESLQRITAATELLVSYSGQLKDFGRRTSLKETGPVDLVAALQCAWKLVAITHRCEAMDRMMNFSDDPVWVVAQDQQLQQVMINLFTNAMDAMRSSPRRILLLSLTQNNDSASLTVHDSGYGLVEADIARIFQPFYTTKPVGEGLGLGLSISYAIIQNFGGTLTAANHPDGGAAFTLTLKKAHVAKHYVS